MNRQPDPEHAEPYPFEVILGELQNRSLRRLNRASLCAALVFAMAAAVLIWGTL